MMKFIKKIILVLLLLVSAVVSADVYTGYGRIYEINTEHFKFIFTDESREAAEYLAGRAEDLYADIADLLDVPVDLHLPVVFTADSDKLNGYFTPLTENRIVLYEAPVLPNNGFTRYNNTLEKLFLHELTHAVSLNIKSPVYKVLAAVLGDFFSPPNMTAPPVFVEGVTVAFESLDGYGRAQQSPYASVIQQDIIEGKFRTFHEASGMRDYPGGIWYVYGGWFSRYLIEEYGTDKYADLWKKLGSCKDIHDFLFVRGAFHTVYGIKVNEAWESFRKWMQIKVPVVTEVRPLHKDYNYIRTVTAHGQYVYYAGQNAVYRYDTGSGNHKKLMRTGYVDRLDVSPDGKKLLISTYAYKEEMMKAVLLVYDLESGKKTAVIKGKYAEACFGSDSLLAVKLKSYSADLVELKNGNETVLFSGSLEMIPSVPSLMADGSIVFLLQKKGDNYLARILKNGEIELLETEEPLTGISNVSCDGENIMFIYNNDLTLPKLARLGEQGLSVQTVPLSGGIQFPVSAASGIYYVGYFSEGRLLMQYPESNPALQLKELGFSWKAFPEGQKTRTVFPQSSGSEYKIRSYNRLWNTLLPDIRIPYPAVDFSRGTVGEMFRGAGLAAFSMDPTEGLSLFWNAAYIWSNDFVHIDVGLSWDVLPVSLDLEVYDRFYFNRYPSAGWDGREMGANLGLYDNISLYPYYRSLLWSIDAGAEIYGGGEYGSNPYSWGLSSIQIPFSVYLEYSDYQVTPSRNDELLGFFLGAGYSGTEDAAEPGWPQAWAKGLLSVSLPFLNFRNDISASFSLHDQLVLQPGNAVLADGSVQYSSFGYSRFYEYSERTDLESRMFFYGDARLGPELKVENSILPGVYIKSILLTGGYRYAFIADEYLDSVYGRMLIDFGLDYGTLNFLPFKAGFEVSCPLRENNSDPLLVKVLMNIGGITGFSSEEREEKRIEKRRIHRYGK